MTIAVAATFTAEPLEERLTYWVRELGLEARIRFARYNQVFQELLDPSSLLLTNENGLNVVLLKPDDWIRFQKDDNHNITPQKTELERKARDFVAAAQSATRRSKVPYVVILCPVSPATAAHDELAAAFNALEAAITSDLHRASGVHCVTRAALLETYPVVPYFDALLDREVHIPYTPAAYAALATTIARSCWALTGRPYKAIVLDCDQTLWNGICGEDAIEDIRIDGPYRALQEFMVHQHGVGMLLCLCSKNNEPDVLRVFDRHPGMVLRRDHIVSWRLGWAPKSQYLESLAEELNLGLDSLIFVDDNPIECAGVRAELPEVLTVQLPVETQTLGRFLRHVWAFDHPVVTEEDRARTMFYAQNAARVRFEKESLTFREFLARLDLNVRIQPMSPDEIPRVAQLTNRTNQFNCTTVRCSESEIQRIYSSGELECLVVQVKDRFGDYGLVGVLMFGTATDALDVRGFLLSCRVLGRGVEHHMLHELGRIARQRHLAHVSVRFQPTGRNQPALDFLNDLQLGSGQPHGEELIFRFPTESILCVTFEPEAATPGRRGAAQRPVTDATNALRLHARSQLFCRIAEELYSAELILRDMEAKKPRLTRIEAPQGYIPPHTATEKTLCEIWKELLGMDRVGAHRNFFDMGGHSLLATQALLRIQSTLGVELSIQDIFEAPTVAELAVVVETRRIERAEPEQVLEILEEIDALTDDQVEALLLNEGQKL